MFENPKINFASTKNQNGVGMVQEYIVFDLGLIIRTLSGIRVCPNLEHMIHRFSFALRPISQQTCRLG